jgi:hypothetical protein
MNDNQRLQLQNMIKANNVEDQTQLIRELKHSVILRNEVNNMARLKSQYKHDEEQLNKELLNECSFLFTYYYDIYNRLKKDEIDVNILHNFLDILKQIEDGELDQHEGSFKVGTILKKLYVDSALKKAEKLDEQYESDKVEPKKPELNISWKQFKQFKK